MTETFRERFDRPLFIVSTPRSGSTLLFETLEQARGLYSTGFESHWLIEDIAGLSPAERGWTSNRLTAIDAGPAAAETLAKGFYDDLSDRDQRPPAHRVRMLEKTPKNALRVPFFNAVWPDSEFIYLYRDVRQTLSSMIEAWRSGAFRTYPGLPGWVGFPWSLLLVPGWQNLKGASLPEIVANQWAITTNLLLDDLEAIAPTRVRAIDYAAFLDDPQGIARSLCASLDLDWDRQLGERLPLSKTTVSDPRPDKWKMIAPVIDAIMPIVEKANERAMAFMKARSLRR